ncbi:MAG: twin-arginine translocase TatA/TatE family subunit [Rhodospirillaceae bacterium]|nr:twin-arginine translocase TatA/TatE family subunit [Rhodospirillaceae bacterium]
MGTMSLWHWIIVLVIVVLLFGAGKIPKLMGDVAKGVKAFKTGLKEELEGDDEAAAVPPKEIKAEPAGAQAKVVQEGQTNKA